mmetsp:Transcript_19895/g.25963  ORF Transcript_19895/g.25963 Transcript_19895/m.25963 type:complete len:202 (-) Transcript_19895:249-854(-)
MEIEIPSLYSHLTVTIAVVVTVISAIISSSIITTSTSTIISVVSTTAAIITAVIASTTTIAIISSSSSSSCRFRCTAFETSSLGRKNTGLAFWACPISWTSTITTTTTITTISITITISSSTISSSTTSTTKFRFRSSTSHFFSTIFSFAIIILFHEFNFSSLYKTFTISDSRNMTKNILSSIIWFDETKTSVIPSECNTS